MINIAKCILLSTIFWSSLASAEFIGSQDPVHIFGSTQIKFGIKQPPMSKVCDYFGRHFKFDATTPKGKNILSILLAAKLANKKIDIWYASSSQPGKDENTGCSTNTLAIIYEIGIDDNNVSSMSSSNGAFVDRDALMQQFELNNN